MVPSIRKLGHAPSRRELLWNMGQSGESGSRSNAQTVNTAVVATVMEFAGIAQNQRRVNDPANLKGQFVSLVSQAVDPFASIAKDDSPHCPYIRFVNSTACINHRTAVEDIAKVSQFCPPDRVERERRYPSLETKNTSSLIPRAGDASTRSPERLFQFKVALLSLSERE